MRSLRNLTLVVISAALVGGAGQAAAADLPKEGTYDITSCWAGSSNSINFSQTHNAVSYEIVGTTRSNPPGGFLDMTSFRCVGFSGTIEGKSSGMNFCEGIDKDGDKILARNVSEGPKNKADALAGTGKYEGIVRIGEAESLGVFPAPKPGSSQGCNHGTGTYKMK